ncbi:hypothetical protein [Streptomyces sp. NPDC001880]
MTFIKVLPERQTNRYLCASLPMLMAKPRYKEPQNVRYFEPPPEAIAGLTSLLAPGGSSSGGA